MSSSWFAIPIPIPGKSDRRVTSAVLGEVMLNAYSWAPIIILYYIRFLCEGVGSMRLMIDRILLKYTPPLISFTHGTVILFYILLCAVFPCLTGWLFESMCSYTFIGVADLFHFDTDPFRGKTDPDPASDPTENRKITNFFLLITKKMIYYLMNIDDIKLFLFIYG